jgi:hypothetical protein
MAKADASGEPVMSEQPAEKWQITLTRHHDILQAIWQADGWSENYTVPIERVIQKTLSVREVLRRLNDFAHANHRAHDAWQDNEFKSLVYDLQQEGEDLYLALLKSDDVETGELIKSRLTEVKRLDLSIRVHKGMALPLGFLFPSHCQPPHVYGRSLDAFRGFWVRDHRITMQAIGGTCRRKKAQDVKVLYAVDTDQFLELIETLQLREDWDPLLALDVGHASDWQTAFDKWRDMTVAHDSDNVFFLFGHNDKAGFHLGRNDRKSREKFIDQFKRRHTDNGSTLLFMNGCSTVGNGDASFLEVAGRPGFCGAIGTEAEISNDFAITYAGRLLNKLLLSGNPTPLGDAFHAMMHEDDLFPRNLLYTCYAYPDFTVAVTRKP